MRKVSKLKFNTDEQETTIVFSRNENTMIIYTSDKTFITKLKRKFIDDEIEILTTDEQGNATSVKVIADKKLLSIRSSELKKL